MRFTLSVRCALSVLGLLATVIFSPQLSYAADKKLTEESCGGIECLIAGYGKSVRANFLTKLPTDSVTTGNIWLIQSDYFKTLVSNKTLSASEKATQNLFVLPGSNDQDMIRTANALYAFNPQGGQLCPNPNPSATGLIPITPIGTSPADRRNKLAGCLTPVDSTYSNISFNTFFGPLTYTDEQQSAAKNFIQMSTLQNLPIKLVDMSKALMPKEGKAPDFDSYASTEPVNTYFALLRLYAAVQATAISNLQQFYDERVPLADRLPAGDKTLAILKDELKLDPKTTSQLQLENYMATRRISDREWYLNLAENSPAMMERQLLALQAENLAETHRLRMAVERLTATMSVMLLQNSFNTRQQLDGARSKVEQASAG